MGLKVSQEARAFLDVNKDPNAESTAHRATAFRVLFFVTSKT